MEQPDRESQAADHLHPDSSELDEVKLAIQTRALRNAYGLSQAELAEIAETSRQTINRIESIDKVSARTRTLEKLHGVFFSRGAEVAVTNQEVFFRFTKDALVECGWGIYGQDEDPSKWSRELIPSIKSAVLVRALRNAFAMSQEELALEADTSVPTLIRIEKTPGASLRSEKLNNVVNVFKRKGVELTILDEEIHIRFTREAVLKAADAIKTPRKTP